MAYYVGRHNVMMKQLERDPEFAKVLLLSDLCHKLENWVKHNIQD